MAVKLLTILPQQALSGVVVRLYLILVKSTITMAESVVPSVLLPILVLF